MSFFAELKRRNVFRVGFAYLVVAWLVVQVADVMIDNLGAPDWVFGTILLVLGIGFPLVLVFAWAFELTPDGLKRDSEVDRSQSIANQTGRRLDRTIIVILALAVAYLLVDKLVLEQTPGAVSGPERQLATADGSPEGVPGQGSRTGAAKPSRESVAVLPFVNMSADPDNEYFSDGLTETLLHMLAQLPELRVAARTSSFAFKGQNRGVAEIAETLGVAHVLEGSVQKAGNQVRVTAQLLRAEDGFHVWSQNYTRPLEDVFAIQDEIAEDVAGALGASLLAAGASPMEGVDTSSLAAYDLYLKGLEQQALGSYAGLEEAERLFQQALVEDPSFTDARLALVRNFMRQLLTGLIDSEALLEATLPLIERVYETHPENKQARAYELMITVRWGDAAESMDDVRETIQEIRNLLAVIPTESFMRTEIATAVAWILDDPQGGIELLRAGLLVDPMDPELHSTLGRVYAEEGRLQEAEIELRRAVELAPRTPGPYVRLSQLEQARNNLPGAMEWGRRAIEIDPRDHELAAQMAEWLYDLELPEEAAPWAERVRTLAPGSAIARN
ncbi:MAG: tetratricopeptide repeat protein, partial [Gammaproteobacteria bacterium]